MAMGILVCSHISMKKKELRLTVKMPRWGRSLLCVIAAEKTCLDRGAEAYPLRLVFCQSDKNRVT